MRKATLKALQESIGHWENMLGSKETLKTGPSTCALCQLFPPSDGCARRDKLGRMIETCPVSAKTDSLFCENSPYDEVIYRLESSNFYTFSLPPQLDQFPPNEQNRIKPAMKEEIAFLKSLLPKLEQKAEVEK